MNKKLREKPGEVRCVRRLRAEPRRTVNTGRRSAGQASARARDRDAGQASLLDRGADGVVREEIERLVKAGGTPDFSPLRERLGYEKELLGFYIHGHPLDEYRADLAAFQMTTIAQLAEIPRRLRRVVRPHHEGRNSHHAERQEAVGAA